MDLHLLKEPELAIYSDAIAWFKLIGFKIVFARKLNLQAKVQDSEYCQRLQREPAHQFQYM